MAGDPPDILIQPVCPKYLRLISIARTLPLRPDSWRGKENGRTFAVGTHQHLTRILSTLKLILTGVGGNSMPLLRKPVRGENMTQPLVGKQILIVKMSRYFARFWIRGFPHWERNGTGG